MIGSQMMLRRMVGVRRVAFSTVVKSEGAAAPVVPVNAAAKPVPVKPTPTPAPTNGSTFFQRFSSFLTGCGVGFAASAYFIYNELEDSNRAFARDIAQLKAQIADLKK